MLCDTWYNLLQPATLLKVLLPYDGCFFHVFKIVQMVPNCAKCLTFELHLCSIFVSHNIKQVRQAYFLIRNQNVNISKNSYQTFHLKWMENTAILVSCQYQPCFFLYFFFFFFFFFFFLNFLFQSVFITYVNDC